MSAISEIASAVTSQVGPPILQLAGISVGVWGALYGFWNLMRGYLGAAVRQISGGLVIGASLLTLPQWYPTLDPSITNAFKAAFGDNDTTATDKADKVAAPIPAPDTSSDNTDVLVTGLMVVGGIIALGIAAYLLAMLAIVAMRFAGVLNTQRTAARTAVEQARNEEDARLDRVWDQAVALHDRLRAEMMRHQSDIDLVLSMPLINDQSDEKTAAFTEALARAADLSYDTRPTSASAVEAYAAATRAADRAWGAAWRNADRVRLSQFAPEERATIKQVAKLMDRAEHETSEEARAAYYRKAVAMLGNLIEIPRPAAEAIEQHLAGVLANPAANSAASEGITVHDVPDNIDQSLFASLLRKSRTKVTQ